MKGNFKVSIGIVILYLLYVLAFRVVPTFSKSVPTSPPRAVSRCPDYWTLWEKTTSPETGDTAYRCINEHGVGLEKFPIDKVPQFDKIVADDPSDCASEYNPDTPNIFSGYKYRLFPDSNNKENLEDLCQYTKKCATPWENVDDLCV